MASIDYADSIWLKGVVKKPDIQGFAWLKRSFKRKNEENILIIFNLHIISQ